MDDERGHRDLGKALAPAGLAVELREHQAQLVAIWTEGAVPGVRSQLRAAIVRAATGVITADLRGSAANSATASQSDHSGIGSANRRLILAWSWSGRASSGGPGATGRVLAKVSAEKARG